VGFFVCCIFINMKIIITESQNNLIRRVYSLIEEYIGELSPDDICTYWRREEGPHYIAESMHNLILIVQKQYDRLSEDEIYDLLDDFGTLTEITEFFYDVIDECN
jgi:hypothetical protein